MTTTVSKTVSGQTSSASSIPVIDYEGSGYRTDFWEGQGRDYEDAVERLALKRLLPPNGRRLAEIGAGFGRLGDLYAGYAQVVLFDYSRTLLQEAVARWGHDPRFVFVAGNVYQLPLARASLDALVMVRVMHHLADVPAALLQLRRALQERGTGVLEYANKRNLKAIGRWFLGRQRWSPWTLEPVEFVELNFDFHPVWMRRRCAEAGFAIQEQLAVSHFRLPWLKRRVSAARLARWDSRLFALGGKVPLSPSVFLRVRPTGDSPAAEVVPGDIRDLFACPVCSGDRTFVLLDDRHVSCRECTSRFMQRDGIWDFKESV